ncbi:MAG: hypothetical protein CL835_01695, partial [Crocinitomicaceae bacterium]|nr:hypothetical protein [Crocinitomicaceae bacterium]
AFQGGLEHFFPKRGVYGFSREQDDVRIVTVVNAANDTRPLPWDNVGPWVQDAVTMERLQPDGTLAADVLTPEDTLGAWSHQVWVIRR